MESVDRLGALLRAYGKSRCVLFAGAGFSTGATSAKQDGGNQPLPTGRDLVKLLKSSLGEDIDDLSALAALFEQVHGEHGLYAMLQSLYVASSITESHETICSYEWKEIYTTNYDNVIELALANSGKRYSIYTSTGRPSDVDHSTLPVVHVNGLVSGTTFNTFKKEIRLTDLQYASDDFSASAWGERFRNDIATAPCVVFAGYSMFDLDVARIIHEFEGMKDRIFFVVKEAPSRAQQLKLEYFGTVVPIGIDGLASLLRDVLSDNAPSSPTPLAAWTKVSIPDTPQRPPRDLDFVNFLMSGSIDPEALAHDVLTKASALAINRTASDQIVSLMETGSLSKAIVTSNIGNGKSTLVEAVCTKLSARNFTVFRASSTPANLLKEVPLIKAIGGKVLLAIDDVYANLDVVRALVATGRPDLFIIAGARTSQFELQEGQVRAVFGDDLEQFDLNLLDNRETDDLIRLLDNYAIWGEKQSLAHAQKARFIRTDCSGELRFVILDILDSPNIRSRIQSLINVEGSPDSKSRVGAVIVSSQLLNLAQVRPELTLIGELLQMDARRAIADQISKLRDFALVRNGEISIRSSIFAEYVLKRLVDTASVMEVILACMRRLDIIFDNNEKYGALFRNFSRFRFVESAIATEKRLAHLVLYFETIKSLNHARENPLFWLQYAICRISLEQYREADRLFDVSFAFSKKIGYVENRHLNNQYARFLLESRTKSNEYTDYMVAFNRAHGILIKQMHDEPLSYNPYRVARNYYAFVERRIGQLSSGDLVGILRSCGEVSRFIELNRKNIRNSRVMDDCHHSIRDTVAKLKAALAVLGVNI